MAEIIENEKGFKILRITIPEIYSWGGLGICDDCCDLKEDNYFIPVLNRCYCDSCYNRWMEKAINYPEDQYYENRKFEEMAKFLNIWNQKNAPDVK